MGLSGYRGQVYYIDASCPTIDCEAYGAEEGTPVCLSDEVTRFSIVDSVTTHRYSHDKSFGWDDSIAGSRRAEITIDANIHHANVDGVGGDDEMHAGKVFYLHLYPAGTDCGEPARGYALVERVSYTYDQRTGAPISYTATLSSKGPWKGLGGSHWGGFECGCTGSVTQEDEEKTSGQL